MSGMSAPENPPAFPNTGAYGHTGDYLPEGGMTLRDYFAGQALAGWCANSSVSLLEEEMATSAYVFADAMLAARNGGNHG